jgi:hypothetical protein
MFIPANARLFRARGSLVLRRLMMLGAFALCCGETFSAQTPNAERATVIVLVGAPGEQEYGRGFAEWAGALSKAAGQAGAKDIIIGLQTNNTAADREQFQQALTAEPKDGAAELWLVLIGHGTFDGREAKFNLRSNDVTATELAGWLQPFRRPLAVINTASASAPFLQKLSGTNRVIVTATRSGSEVNYARFGQYFSTAVADPEADLDKDGQTSLLEAFLMASRRVKEFYDLEGRLATEHALLDDNGDGFGTPPDWFRGVRAVKSAKDGAALDGFRAHQFHLIRSEAERKLPAETRARRDVIEFSISKLRDTKRGLPEEVYYEKLEALLLELARLYEAAGK